MEAWKVLAGLDSHWNEEKNQLACQGLPNEH
jgi:hypothetical protein